MLCKAGSNINPTIKVTIKVYLTPKNVFCLINSMYIELLNSEIFLFFNVTLVSYRDVNLQNANKATSIQDSFIIQLLVFTSK